MIINPFKLGFYFVIVDWMECIQISAFQAVSIMGNEVFHFNLDLYPDATEGDSYTDMSKVDSVVSLNVGCIQIVYLHKFLMSLLVKSLFIYRFFDLEILKISLIIMIIANLKTLNVRLCIDLIIDVIYGLM